MLIKIKAEYLATEEFEIEAESPEEARRMFDEGEVPEGHCTGYMLNKVISIEEA